MKIIHLLYRDLLDDLTDPVGATILGYGANKFDSAFIVTWSNPLEFNAGYRFFIQLHVGQGILENKQKL